MTDPISDSLQGINFHSIVGEDGFVYDNQGVGVAGKGEYLRQFIPSSRNLEGISDQVSAILQKIRRDAIAFVVIPFAPTRPVRVIVPEIAVRKNADSTINVVVCGNPEIGPLFQNDIVDDDAQWPRSFNVTASRSPKEWCDSVQEAVLRIRRGELSKVALTREVVIEADRAFSQVSILKALQRSYPASALFGVDGLVGASPELLIERSGLKIRSIPLAGTLPRSSDPGEDVALRNALFNSKKDQLEHKFLSDMITSTLGPLCSELNVPDHPQILSLANVHHLATPVSGKLLNSFTTALDLVSALHPTPAVAGTPTDLALQAIEELEELDRGYYAGAVGWMDAQGDGSFSLAIRCAQIEGNRARVIAGNGIVADSVPEKELEETRWKMQVMLSALIQP